MLMFEQGVEGSRGVSCLIPSVDIAPQRQVGTLLHLADQIAQGKQWAKMDRPISSVTASNTAGSKASLP
ncbi:hypothetical protein [Ectopseudomonas composti]|uniref:hypothetical protein n=1 Tax=Ectopseudomonas composti TaxID=658457 RepID=UPI0012E35672|nr:hypothetical protein [Pseudomonas composti]